MADWDGASESDLKAAGVEPLPDGRRGLRLKGWHIESIKRPILGSLARQEYVDPSPLTPHPRTSLNCSCSCNSLEEKLGTSHLPEMVFGDSSLFLLHVGTGIKLHFNAFDALKGWMQEALPPVEVPAAAKWKFRRTRFAISTFTAWYGWYIPVCQVAGTRTACYRAVPPKIDCRRSIEGEIGSIKEEKGKKRRGKEKKEEKKRTKRLSSLAHCRRPRLRFAVARARRCPHPCKETEHLPARGERSRQRHRGDVNWILISLMVFGLSKPSQQVILDYDYTFTTPYCGSETSESELEKVWLFFALSILPLRVDGVLMRLRDTRVYCSFASDDKVKPIIIRENCWREATIQSLSVQGFPSGSAAYADPNLISQNLPIVKHKTQRLKIP
ncbi:hypothetical protein GW17_00050597, partial [Ensete ventricosum]